MSAIGQGNFHDVQTFKAMLGKKKLLEVVSTWMPKMETAQNKHLTLIPKMLLKSDVGVAKCCHGYGVTWTPGILSLTKAAATSALGFPMSLGLYVNK